MLTLNSSTFFVADMVIPFVGSFRVADVVVADMVCGRYGCGRYGLWPIWYRPLKICVTVAAAT